MKFRLTGLGLVSMLLAACANAPGSTVNLAGTTWQLASSDQGVLAQHAADSRVTMHFGADRLDGFGGCNSYNATYGLSDGKLSIGPVAATKRGCMGHAGDVERAWFAALAAPLSVTRNGANLEMRTADGVLLRFIPGSGLQQTP